MVRDCIFFDATVDIHNGYFVTPRRPVNKGAKHQTTGYRMINLRRKGEQGYSVLYMHHAIYCEANGVSKLPRGFQIHHIDGNKENNCISNLCLCTAKYNCLCAAATRDYSRVYATRQKNGFKQKIRVRSESFDKTYPSINQAGRELGICNSRISEILNNKTSYKAALSKTSGKKFTFQRL